MKKELQTAKIIPSRVRAAIDQNSFNAADKTVEVAFATGTPVRRFDWKSGTYYNEVLEISEKAIDFSRLKNGAAVLDTHNSYGLANVLGVVEDAWVSGNEARAKVKLSEEKADATTVNKIQKGIIRNLSVGYDVSEYTISEVDAAKIATWTATRWQPMELSFVPVPADQNAGVRSEEKQQFSEPIIVNPTNIKMKVEEQRNQPESEINQPTAVPTTAKSEGVSVEEIRKTAIADERKRVSDITDACKRAGLPVEISEKLVSDGKTIDQARADIIDEVAKRANPAPVGASAHVTGEDEADQIRDAIVSGMIERANPGAVKDISKNEKALQFRNMRLLDLAKDRLRVKGERFTMLSEQEIVKRAFSTTDFPDLLSSSFDRSLRRFYDSVSDEWSFIARQESATDFREKTGIKVDGAVTFEEIPENGEYRESPILQNEKATIKLKKFGRKYSITDVAIINDDLSVFSRLPQIMALGAQQFQSAAIWGNVISNKNAWDGVALFHATHKNLEATTANKVAPGEISLSAARAAMRRQKSPAGSVLGISPRFLIVPPELETIARKLVTAIIANATGSVNVFANAFEVVVVNQLTDTDAWYLAADPNAISADGIVYAYLNGAPGLRTESRVNFDTDALEVKGSMAFATAIWGWQGWFKNPGK